MPKLLACQGEGGNLGVETKGTKWIRFWVGQLLTYDNTSSDVF